MNVLPKDIREIIYKYVHNYYLQDVNKQYLSEYKYYAIGEEDQHLFNEVAGIEFNFRCIFYPSDAFSRIYSICNPNLSDVYLPKNYVYTSQIGKIIN